MIHHITASRACHILTIEDPVEFVHESLRAQVTHREVGPDASTFATAIRSAAREDPQVILVGELRNNETMKLALQLASFGVLVFATVHTNSAPATIERIINAFPADEQPQIRGMLSESLVGVVAQQLLKTLDGKGRVAVHEILLGSTGIASMIREGKTFQIASLMQSGKRKGCKPWIWRSSALPWPAKSHPRRLSRRQATKRRSVAAWPRSSPSSSKRRSNGARPTGRRFAGATPLRGGGAASRAELGARGYGLDRYGAVLASRVGTAVADGAPQLTRVISIEHSCVTRSVVDRRVGAMNLDRPTPRPRCPWASRQRL